MAKFHPSGRGSFSLKCPDISWTLWCFWCSQRLLGHLQQNSPEASVIQHVTLNPWPILWMLCALVNKHVDVVFDQKAEPLSYQTTARDSSLNSNHFGKLQVLHFQALPLEWILLNSPKHLLVRWMVQADCSSETDFWSFFHKSHHVLGSMLMRLLPGKLSNVCGYYY